MYFSANIKLLRNRKNRTQEDVSVALDMKRSTLSGYENNVAQPNLEALIAFSGYYKVSLDILVKEDLSTWSEKRLTELEMGFDTYIKGSKLRVLATTVNDEGKENIELVNEKAKAGYTTGFADPEFIERLPTFNLPFLHKERKYRSFQISGDSMLPIPSGAYVTGEFIMDWRTIKSGTPCIIVSEEDGIVFKVVDNHLAERKVLVCKSLNPLFSPFEMRAADVKEVWKFVHYISTQLPEPSLNPSEIVQALVQLQRDVTALKGSA